MEINVIDQNGTIFRKLSQICVYTNDISFFTQIISIVKEIRSTKNNETAFSCVSLSFTGLEPYLCNLAVIFVLCLC